MLKNAFYVIGGCAISGERNPISSIERITVEAGETKLHVKVNSKICGNLNYARRAPSVFRWDLDSILVLGGCFGPDKHSDSVEILRKTPNGEFRTESVPTFCKQPHSCAGFDSSMSNRMVIFGGFNTHDCLSTVQIISEHDSKIDVRSAKGLLPKLKNAAVCAIENDKFLVFGGWEDEKVTSSVVRKIDFDDEYDEFEADLHGFMPYPLEAHSLIRKGNAIYLIGGFDGCFVTSKIVRYDLLSKKFEVLEVELKKARENHVSALVGNEYLVVAGGWDSKQALNNIEVYKLIDEAPYLLEMLIENGTELEVARNRPSGVVL